MPPISQADMAEATRLTREGRLHEAMAILQGQLDVAPPVPPTPGPPPGRPARRAGPVIDLVPPSAGSAGAWTVPPNLGSRAAPRRPATARAPAASPPGARWEERLHAGPAGSRPYRLYVPGAPASGPRPLLLMLHGCTQSPDDFAAGTRMNALAEEHGLIVAWPGQTPAANPQRCWNWFNAADQARGRGEAALLAALAREVIAAEGADPDRTYVAGLSAGGAAAAVLAATHPEIFAAAGVHSGLACGAARDMPGAFAAMRSGAPGAAATGPARPMIVFHGDRDGTVHPSNAEEVLAQAAAGAAHRTETETGRSGGGVAFTRTIHRDGDGRAMLENWVLHGAGHAWSGGSAAGSYTDPRGPDASREMVRFFLAHRNALGR